jgi:glucokinase
MIAGIDFGGTKISAVLTDGNGRVLERGSAPAPASEGGDAMVSVAVSLVQRFSERPTAVGVGAAGVVDHVSGTIVAASSTFAGWTGYPLGERLSAALEVPVHVENDVQAALAGEHAWGAVRGASDVLAIMLGTGVGGGLILDGKLRHGPHAAAGEIGHTPGYSSLVCSCGQIGHLETMAAGRFIAKRYSALTGASVADAETVESLARSGDQAALSVFKDAGTALSQAILVAAGLIDITDVVIGGGVANAWDLFWPSLSAGLSTAPPVSGATVRVVKAELGSDAVALGAAALAGAAA